MPHIGDFKANPDFSSCFFSIIFSLKWFECHECHDEFMDHPMGSSPILTLACLSCNMLFKKDLSIFGDQDELCPHCDNRYIKEAKTNEGELFKQGMEEIVDMLEFATERNKGIKTTCELELIGTLAEDEESVVSQMSQEDIGRAEELEKRKTKVSGAKRQYVAYQKHSATHITNNVQLVTSLTAASQAQKQEEEEYKRGSWGS